MSNPRVAVGLFGIHYIDKLNHWMDWSHTVDYRACLANNRARLYSLYNPDYYSSTYHSPITDELIKDFGFKALKLKEVDNTKGDMPTTFRRRNRVFKETIELILNSGIEYDFVILTRYDAFIRQDINALSIDWERINFLCRSKWGDKTGLADDNFYIIPYSLLRGFYETLLDIPGEISSHDYPRWFKEVNYMVEGDWYSHEIAYHQICRIPLI